MTTENRIGQFLSRTGAPETESFQQLISSVRRHGEMLLAQGKEPQLVSVAVHALLLHHFPDTSIHRRTESPFDVAITINEKDHLIFLDIECHRIVWDVLRYLVSDNQESETWNLN